MKYNLIELIRIGNQKLANSQNVRKQVDRMWKREKSFNKIKRHK